MAIFYYTDRPILLVTLLLSYALTVRSQQQILIPSTAEARAINTPVPEKTLGNHVLYRSMHFFIFRS
jgi:hypothetical protein